MMRLDDKVATCLKITAADQQINRLARRRLNGLHCFVNFIQLAVAAPLNCHLRGTVCSVSPSLAKPIEPASHDVQLPY